MTYRFLSPAHRDLVEAMDYYDRAAVGLGQEFLEEVERAIGRILLQPEAWKRISANHRRCLLRRFSFPLVLNRRRRQVGGEREIRTPGTF